ncbi:MAG: hypothetical protein R3F43_01715 [bacterium]
MPLREACARALADLPGEGARALRDRLFRTEKAPSVRALLAPPSAWSPRREGRGDRTAAGGGRRRRADAPGLAPQAGAGARRRDGGGADLEALPHRRGRDGSAAPAGGGHPEVRAPEPGDAGHPRGRAQAPAPEAGPLRLPGAQRRCAVDARLPPCGAPTTRACPPRRRRRHQARRGLRLPHDPDGGHLRLRLALNSTLDYALLVED